MTLLIHRGQGVKFAYADGQQAARPRRHGLWVDVDPSLQATAASLLVKFDFVAGLPGTFKVFAYDDSGSAHAVSSTTRS